MSAPVIAVAAGSSIRSRVERAVSGVAALGLMLVASALTAPAAYAASGCDQPFLLPTGDGPTVRTSAGFYQRVQVLDCFTYPEKSFVVRVHVSPFGSYAGSHVQACTMHVALSDSLNGYVGEEIADCTANARTGSPYNTYVPGWHLSRANPSRAWQVRGYVNIRTGVKTYNTHVEGSVKTFQF